MDAIDYCEVLNGALDAAGVLPSRLNTTQFDRLRRSANLFIREAVKKQFWPELVLLEQRWFAPKYSSVTAYVNDGTVTYFAQTQQYYFALCATTGNPPADGNGITDVTRWAVAEVNLPRQGTTNWYQAGNTYNPGDVVYYPVTDLWYACIAASTGNLPTAAAFFGQIFVWDRYVPYTQTTNIIRQPLWVGDRNPRAQRNAREVQWEESQNGIQVMERVPYVWIKYRAGIAQLKGCAWDPTATYAAGRQAYFESQPNYPGNFYVVPAGQAPAPGQSPATTPAAWSVIQIPVRFGNFLTSALYAEWLKADGQNDKYAQALQVAGGILDEEAYELAAAEQQRLPMECQTR
jgi:hypothetical protein